MRRPSALILPVSLRRLVIKGKLFKAKDCDIALFLHVKGKWYNKPDDVSLTTPVADNGEWECQIAPYTDLMADHVRVFAMPRGTMPVSLGPTGAAEIPAEMYEVSEATAARTIKPIAKNDEEAKKTWSLLNTGPSEIVSRTSAGSSDSGFSAPPALLNRQDSIRFLEDFREKVDRFLFLGSSPSQAPGFATQATFAMREKLRDPEYSELRRQINEMIPHAKALLQQCHISALLNVRPPPIIGGPIVQHHLLDLVVQNIMMEGLPKEMVLDKLDQALGVLRETGGQVLPTR